MNRTTRTLLDLALGVAVAYLLLFVGLALLRLTYPFDLEWMEGGMVSHAARLQAGLPIYAAPSADFVPFFYTPGYPALLAALAPVTGGLGFGLARGVSLVSTLVAMGFLFRIGQREAGWRWGLLAAGLYAALFRVNGAFYDLARPDALFTALLMAAVYTVRYGRGWRGVALAAALFAAGFFTKQTVSVFVPACALYLLTRDWRHAVGFVAVTLGLAAAGVALLDRAHDGWFWTYIFEGHQGHLFYWKNILLEYWRDLLVVAPLLLLLPLLWFRYKVAVPVLAMVLGAWWLYAWLFRARGFEYDAPHMYYVDLWYYSPPRWRILVPSAVIAALLLAFRALNRRPLSMRTHGFWLLMFIAGAGASGLNHSTQWAYSNSLILLSLFACILISLAVRDLLNPVEGPPRAGWLLPAALLVQLGAWVYDPVAQLPLEADRAALATLDEALAGVKGRVFMPAHPLYGWQRDGQVHVHQMGIQDVAFWGPQGLHPSACGGGASGGGGHRRAEPRPRRRGRLLPGPPPRYATPTPCAPTGFLVRPAEIWLAQDPRPQALIPGIDANFEGARYTGWLPDGPAFGTRPVPRPATSAGRAGGAQRQRRPQARGRISPASPSTLPRRALSFLLGGSGRGKVAVRVDAGARARAHARQRPQGRAGSRPPRSGRPCGRGGRHPPHRRRRGRRPDRGRPSLRALTPLAPPARAAARPASPTCPVAGWIMRLAPSVSGVDAGSGTVLLPDSQEGSCKRDGWWGC
ncbi:MAG: glycosyltransferase 87 family protein [bacterium]